MRETQIEISRKNLLHNLNVFTQKIHPNTKILANLKANAYGIGAIAIGKFLEKQGISYFSIAYINEGIHLRKNGIKTNILLFNPSIDNFEELISYQLEPEVSSIYYLQKLIAFLQKNDIHQFPIHLKLDTGMHRAGIMPEELAQLIEILQKQTNVKVSSVFSHLAAAEDPKSDDFTKNQIATFEKMTQVLSENYSDTFFRHLLNSAGIFRFPEAQYDMIRPGLGLFGYTLIDNDKDILKPILSLKTKITQIKNLKPEETVGYNRTFKASKKTKVALLPIGYADGINRHLKGFKVQCKGNQVPIIGNVSMDTMSIDITHTDCQIGDEVIVINNTDDVYKMAQVLKSIPYEVTANLSHRIPRKMI